MALTDSDQAVETRDVFDSSPQEVFQQQWQTYRTMVDENYLFHREAYGCLRQLLLDEAPPSFRFLDLACGDGVEILAVLEDMPVGQYHGVDLSRSALDLAEEALASLDCPVLLEERDMVEVIATLTQPADVVWIGVSLHHFRFDAKLDMMRAIRAVVGDRGLLVSYEPTCANHETRDDWLRRWDAQQESWTAYTQETWDTMAAHVHAADFPETPSQWHELGTTAGFATTREVFVAPSNLFRMYRFGP
jgi:SAM-dependent methyltransferase